MKLMELELWFLTTKIGTEVRSNVWSSGRRHPGSRDLNPRSGRADAAWWLCASHAPNERKLLRCVQHTLVGCCQPANSSPIPFSPPNRATLGTRIRSATDGESLKLLLPFPLAPLVGAPWSPMP